MQLRQEGSFCFNFISYNIKDNDVCIVTILDFFFYKLIAIVILSVLLSIKKNNIHFLSSSQSL